MQVSPEPSPPASVSVELINIESLDCPVGGALGLRPDLCIPFNTALGLLNLASKQIKSGFQTLASFLEEQGDSSQNAVYVLGLTHCLGEHGQAALAKASGIPRGSPGSSNNKVLTGKLEAYPHTFCFHRPRAELG